ncbi:hypothetical protein [Roseibium aggregatum]|uniref:Uncharacterized protein n=1 Tax=Roseibium aggregatum TaxID=187304 RepID=A0A0M6Y861_9HYPH|nr:hypothetical protein [Roseibium aggregatum]CTQ45723.1 hypothetical protein LAL4801_04178 [Roseibium aggregatum]
MTAIQFEATASELGWRWSARSGGRKFHITASFDFPDEFVVWRESYDGEKIPFDNVSSLWKAQQIVAEKIN